MLGDNSQTDKPQSLQIGTDLWLQIDAGINHTCGVKSDQTLWCWGGNDRGELGLGPMPPPDVFAPQQVSIDANWLHVSGGDNFTCGLKIDGTIHCWGHGANGRLAQDAADTTDKSTPIPIVATQVWQSLSVGYDHACALADDNTMWCWGQDAKGETGQNDFGINLYLPAQVGSNSDWLIVKGGENITCGIKTDIDVDSNPTDQLYCWGTSENSQLGNGGLNSEASSPGLVAGDATNWRSVSTHSLHSCGVKHDNTMWCWGENFHGTIGNGFDSPTGREEPDPVQIGNADWLTVGVGFDHTCAIKQDNTMWCWGENNKGQLGNGSAWSSDPLQVRFP